MSTKKQLADLNVLELKGVLFDLNNKIQQIQQQAQQVVKVLQEKEQEAEKEAEVVEEVK